MKITKALRTLAAKAATVLGRFSVGYGYPGRSGGSNDAGIRVDRDKALTSATFYAGMNLIGMSIAHLGFGLYRPRKSGGLDLAADHPLNEVLRYEPNRHQTAIEYWQRLIWDQELTGDGFSRVVRNASGVIGLIPWEPERVKIYTDPGPEWLYRYQPPKGERVDLDEHGAGDLLQVFHLRNVTVDGVHGLSTVDLAQQRLGLDLAVEKYGAAFFGKGGRVKDIFRTPGTATLSPEQRAKWKALFRDEYGNTDKFHEAMLLEAGVELVGKSGATPNEAQFLETQVANAIALCRFLGIPPTLVGILERATYNNQEQLMLQFLTLCLTPRVTRIEQAARRALLTPSEKRSGFTIKCKLQKLLRADAKTRAEFYRMLAEIGAIANANEIRELEDMPPIDDPAAWEYFGRAENIFGPKDPAQAGADAGAEAARQEVQRTAA